MDSEFLKIICCPETHQALAVADTALCERLNAQILAGTLRNRCGQLIKETLQGALVRADGNFLYPIRHDIPIMLVEESIALRTS